METISVNKQLLQEDSRGTEKSDTDLARRQESHWLSSEARTVRNIYVQLNSIHFGACVICLWHPQCHTSDFGQQKQHFFFPFSTVPFPASQILCLGSVPFLPPSKSFFSKPISLAGFPLDSQKGSRRPKPQIHGLTPLRFIWLEFTGFKTGTFSWSKSFQTPTLNKKQNTKLHHFL